MKRLLWLAPLLGLMWGQAGAQSIAEYSLTPLPEQPDATRYASFEPKWRTHLLQVREAMKNDDLLQRCLAWPDLPGNQWPAGHAAAHCHNHFDAQADKLGLTWLETQLDAGDLSSIDAALDAQLARHFQPGPAFHESIHQFYEKIDSDERSDALTSRWLRAAPENAYAVLARATYYRRAAWKARGAKYAANTPESQLSTMSQYVERAVPLFRKAIALNPRLMPAYEGMLNVATADSLDAVAVEALQGAQVQDPACPSIAMEFMNAIKPRWGGSHEAMTAYAEKLKPHVASRPLLGLYLASPHADMADVLDSVDTAEAEQAAYELGIEALKRGSLDSAMANLGSVTNAISKRAKQPAGARGESIAYLLQAVRFGTAPLWARRWLAETFMWREPGIGLRLADSVIREEPTSHAAHYFLAAALYNTRQYAPADHHYRFAMEDKTLRMVVLREVAQMWLTAPAVSNELAVAKGAPYVAVLEKEYPKQGGAAFLHLNLEYRRTGRVQLDSMRKALAGHDGSDAWQAGRAGELRKMLEGAPETP